MLFLKNVSSTLIEGFCRNQRYFTFAKNYKIWWRKNSKKKYVFSFFKRHLQQTWWAENMPVVASRLVGDFPIELQHPTLEAVLSAEHSISWLCQWMKLYCTYLTSILHSDMLRKWITLPQPITIQKKVKIGWLNNRLTEPSASWYISVLLLLFDFRSLCTFFTFYVTKMRQPNQLVLWNKLTLSHWTVD